jgi:hypothetical protein
VYLIFQVEEEVELLLLEQTPYKCRRSRRSRITK